MKKYVLPLFMFLAALFLTVTAAASDVLGLHDGAKLLQTSERTAVMKELQDVEKRYGAVYVNRSNHDLKDLKRVPKKSFYWSQKVLKNNGDEI